MLILGIHHEHDSAAALIRDGEIVADAAEERFTRIKHYCGLPFRAVDFCLKQARVSIEDVDAIAISSMLQRPDLNFLFQFPSGKEQKPSLQRSVLETIRRIRNSPTAHPPLYLPSFKVANRTQIFNVEHHLAHAASAVYTSGLREKQLVLTLDGSGDGFSTCIWRAEHGRIEPLEKWGFDGSIGVFYSNVTEALGWWHGDGEGKTMGLAPYGNPESCAGVLRGFFPRFEHGRLAQPAKFGRPAVWNEQGAKHFHLKDAEEIARLVGVHGRENIAAEAQRVLEEQVAELVFPWLEREGHSNLTCSGGVFLNVKLNQRLWESGRIANHWIYPNPGDSGLAVGAALWVYHQLVPDAPPRRMESLALGPEFSEEEILRMLELRKVPCQIVENPAEFAAHALAENQIVAWVQGRMESGPRALGNRSILMSADRAENKDIINSRVKFREGFRPFCPSLLSDAKERYMEHPREENFMITSFTCPASVRANVPAVVHVDHTLRPQTVNRSISPLYHEMIHSFAQLTGDPLVLNTSLNVMGEPIALGPREALRCFFDTGLDHAILGRIVVSKK